MCQSKLAGLIFFLYCFLTPVKPVNSTLNTYSSGNVINPIEIHQKFILNSLSLDTIARCITVKISAGKDFWGSGVLIHSENGVYTVITNDHVVNPSKIEVTTFDGEVYSGKLLISFQKEDVDLAVVQFQSNRFYKIAKIGNSVKVTEGDFIRVVSDDQHLPFYTMFVYVYIYMCVY